MPKTGFVGPAPGKQLGFALDFGFLLWLRFSGRPSPYREPVQKELGCGVVGRGVVGRGGRESAEQGISDPVALRMSAKRPSWP